MHLIKSWRWFGLKDPVKLPWLKEMGIEEVVTSLHSIPNGEVWPVKAIKEVKDTVESAGLGFSIIESLPVTEAIKTGSALRKKHIRNYKTSLKNLSECGIKTVLYNFMPVIDWVRTDLRYKLPGGGESLLFDYPTFAAFDIYILERPDAEKEYPETILKKAEKIIKKMRKEEAEELAHNIIIATQRFVSGISCNSTDYKKDFLEHLDNYKLIAANQLRENLAYFLHEIIPVAEQTGINMAIHPDDPPFPVLGLPRIFSTIDDMDWLQYVSPSLNNGISFCSGSFSARKDNDLPEMIRKYGNRIHFAHLRNTLIKDDGSFYESGHIKGRINMVEVVKALLQEQNERKADGRSDYRLAVRPDHGIKILDDLGLKTNPGYSLMGRLKGLSEIRGIEEAVIQQMK